MQLQMEALQGLVKSSQRREEERARRSIGGEGKLTKLAESDDIESYLTMLERMMQIGRVEEGEWILRPSPIPDRKGPKGACGHEQRRCNELWQGEGGYTAPLRYVIVSVMVRFFQMILLYIVMTGHPVVEVYSLQLNHMFIALVSRHHLTLRLFLSK